MNTWLPITIGIAGIGAFEDLGPPGKVKVDLAVGRVEGEQTAAGQDEAPAPAVDGRQHRTGIAGQLVADAVADLAGAFVEGDDARLVALDVAEMDLIAAGRTAAHLHDEQVAFHHRRAADAEEVLHDAELRPFIDLPDDLAVLGVDAVEHAFDAVAKDQIAVDDRGTAWAVVVAVLVGVVGRDIRSASPRRRSSCSCR